MRELGITQVKNGDDTDPRDRIGASKKCSDNKQNFK